MIIEGNPKGKGRPKFTKNGHAYTPAATREYEEYIRNCYFEQDGTFHEGYVFAVISAFYPLPSKAKKAERADMLAHRIRPSGKPDIDNVVKAVLDALNGAAYSDDSNVVGIFAEKYYSENPRIVVKINEVEGK